MLCHADICYEDLRSQSRFKISMKDGFFANQKARYLLVIIPLKCRLESPSESLFRLTSFVHHSDDNIQKGITDLQYDIARHFEKLENDQQRTDLIQALRSVLIQFDPIPTSMILAPEKVTTKGRPRGLKNSRLPSGFEIAEKADKLLEKQKKK